MSPEFALIERFFARRTPHTLLGVGDDAALCVVSDGMQLAVSTDMLVAGTHFYPDTDPRKLGWKTLAVNLSDMAAMGATPRWATLAIAIPKIEDPWLSAFADGFFKCAQQFDVDLIGGDTTRGPMSFSVTIFGEVPPFHALRRDKAKPGDDIWVSGTLGAAALALAQLQQRVELEETDSSHCRRALETPQPRVALGIALHGMAHAAIDISDGLLADLGHILERSQVGAELCFDAIPAHPVLEPLLIDPLGRNCLLAGGDDYELCFTAAQQNRDDIQILADQLALKLTRIGTITTERQLRLLDAAGQPIPMEKSGYDHFA